VARGGSALLAALVVVDSVGNACSCRSGRGRPAVLLVLCVHRDRGLRRRRRYLASFQYSFTAALVAPAFFTTVFEVRHWLPWLVLGLLNILAALGVRRLERIVPAPDLRLSA
jgi:hypothetical protein